MIAIILTAISKIPEEYVLMWGTPVAVSTLSLLFGFGLKKTISLFVTKIEELNKVLLQIQQILEDMGYAKDTLKKHDNRISKLEQDNEVARRLRTEKGE